MNEINQTCKKLIDLFLDNSKVEFEIKTLPTIFKNKGEFNLLTTKDLTNMFELTFVIDEAKDLKATLREYIWSSCKSCHSKFRAEH